MIFSPIFSARSGRNNGCSWAETLATTGLAVFTAFVVFQGFFLHTRACKKIQQKRAIATYIAEPDFLQFVYKQELKPMNDEIPVHACPSLMSSHVDEAIAHYTEAR